jgi:hypothetical protein
MDRKILIIGNGPDVITKKRGKFIDKYFDDVLICNQSLFKLESHKEYLGNPTIWGTCGWTKVFENTDLTYSEKTSMLFDPSKELKDTIYDCLINSSIQDIWINQNSEIMSTVEFDFEIPEHIPTQGISNGYNIEIYGKEYHSLGLQSIIHSFDLYEKVYYMGIDSYTKGHHWYQEEELDNTMFLVHGGTDYFTERMIMRDLIKENKVIHIDEVF